VKVDEVVFMIMVAGQQQTLAVEVKSPLPQRTQMWAKLAGQAMSFDEFNLIYKAFSALWWEADAAGSFEKVIANLHEGSMRWAIEWLGHTIFEVEQAVGFWQRISELLTPDATVPRRLVRFVKDTSTHMQELMQQVAALRTQTAEWCEQYGLPLPERLREEACVEVNVVEA
jgi:hypothetical protein